ncbi:MAG: hypothetical protein V4478_00520 [Patescibacteria group bacterium]
MYSETKKKSKPVIKVKAFLLVNDEMFKGIASLFGTPKKGARFVATGTTFTCKSNPAQNAPLIAIAEYLPNQSAVTNTVSKLVQAGFILVEAPEREHLISTYTPELALAAELQH